MPETFADDRPLGEHNVAASFDGPDPARAAITALERRGVEAAHISVLGPVSEEEEASPGGSFGADAEETGGVARRVAKGAVAGSVAGGALGAGVALVIPGIGPVLGAGTLAAALGGAIGGGGIGGMVAGISGLGMSEAWQRTYEQLEGGLTCVAVHSDDPAVIDRAESVLREQGPLSVYRFDGQGRVEGE